jgi:ketosteroid isomerase-like protein
VSSPNVEAVRNSLDGWNRGDVDSWLEAAHPDIEWTSEWHAVWVLTIEVSEIRELGDTVVALGRVRARGQASGIDFDRPIAYVFEFEGGLVRQTRSYLDIERALEAAGMAD